MRDDIGDGQPAAGSSGIRFREPVFDLFGIEQHVDGDRRVGRKLQVVYGQLWRNAGRNRSIHKRQPGFHHDILCSLGDGELHEFHLRNDDGNGQPAAGSSDIRVGEPILDLFGIKQHADRDGRVRR